MKITIISGSHSVDSQSSKVSHWLSDELKARDDVSDVSIIDLGGNPLPLWDKDAWDQGSELTKVVAPYLQKVEDADALILVSPEWGGMVPAGLKNFLLYVGSQQAAHKPTLIAGVSASRGGTYPVAELRLSGFKNNRMVYIPDHIIVQFVENVLNDHDADGVDEADDYIKRRARYSLNVLVAYAKALKPMRDAGGLLSEDFPFGM